MLLHQSKTEKILYLVRESISEFFKMSIIIYLFCYLIENYYSGFISDYFDLKYILWVIFISGALTVWATEKKQGEDMIEKNISLMNIVFIILLGFLSSCLIYYKIKTIGTFAFIVAFAAGIAVVLLSSILVFDLFDDGPTENSGKIYRKIKSLFKE